MELSATGLILVTAAGLAAGFINVVAGGGSLITMPTMILLGMPPAMANGTNRIALLSQSGMATTRFFRRGYLSLRAGLLLGLSASGGAVVGSLIAVEISGELFNRILSGVMLLVLYVTLSGSRKITGDERIRNLPVLVPAFFLVGIYGGFIQAGVGILIMAVFSRISGTDLVRTNAVKAMVILLYTIPALAVFVYNDQVAWLAGVFLASGQAAGAWLGACFSMEKGDRWIKAVLTVAVLIMAGRLFFFT